VMIIALRDLAEIATKYHAKHDPSQYLLCELNSVLTISAIENVKDRAYNAHWGSIRIYMWRKAYDKVERNFSEVRLVVGLRSPPKISYSLLSYS